MSSPFVSVILPVYNGENYLIDAIDSILSQTYTDFELIIINDGSTDGSLVIAQKYQVQDDRIVLFTQENIGLAATLNRGILLAKGKYIARMDQDDKSLENRFHEQVKLLEKGYDLCGCHYHYITAAGKLSNSLVVSTDSQFQSIILTGAVPFAHGSVMIRKSFLLESNLKYSIDEFSSAEDYYLWTLCFEHGAKIANVDKYLFVYRDFELSLSKLNANKNTRDAKAVSRRFIIKNFQKIEFDLKERFRLEQPLNIFEQQHAAFFLFNTLFKRDLRQTLKYLRSVRTDVKLVAFFRWLSFFYDGLSQRIRNHK